MRDVLIVDDDADGCAALAVMVAADWNAVILDIRMPEMDGVKLLEILRSYLRWHALPVLVLTAQATPEQLRQVRDLGVAQVFWKTQYTPAEMRDALDAATGGPILPP